MDNKDIEKVWGVDPGNIRTMSACPFDEVIEAKGSPTKETDVLLTIKGYSSTNDRDEYKETVQPSAFKDTMGQFAKFPIYLLNHRYDEMPIGKIADWEIRENGLWTVKEILNTSTGRDAAVLVKGGVLKADSIGFTNTVYGDDDETDIISLRLLEISLVNIPANEFATHEEVEEVKHLITKYFPGMELETKQQLTNKGDSDMDPTETKKLIDDALEAKKVEVATSAAESAVKTVEPKIEAVKEDLETLKAQAAEAGKTVVTKAELEALAEKFAAVDKELELTKKMFQQLSRPEGNVIGPDILGDELKDFPSNTHPILAKLLFAKSESMGNMEAKHRRWKVLNDVMYLLNSAKTYRASITGGGYAGPTSLKFYKEWAELTVEFEKAMSSDAGYGGDFIPTGLSSDLTEMIEMEATVSNLFPTFPMPTNPYKVPYKSSHLTFYRYDFGQAVDFPTQITKSGITTGYDTLTAYGFAAANNIDADVSEDAMISIRDMVLHDYAVAWARYMDDAVINGDTDTTHRDTGHSITGTTDHRTAFEGLRKQANTDSAEVTAATVDAPLTADFEPADLIRVLTNMGAVATPARLKDIVFLMSLKKWWLMQLFTERHTVDKAGDRATINQGPNDRIYGIQCIPSEFIRDDYDDNGIYTGTGSASVVLAVYRPPFKIGIRRPLLIETQKNIHTQQTETVATARRAFQLVRSDSSKVVYTLIAVKTPLE